MKNELRIIESLEKNKYIAIFSGKTGSDEIVQEEEAHNIGGVNRDEIIKNALFVWGADLEETRIDFE